MGIDPMTFIAQIINLFVLVWILKRFLYRPVLQVIEKRQSEINQENQSIFQKSKEIDKMHLDLQKEKAKYEAFEEQQRVALEKEIQKVRTKELNQLKEQISVSREKSLKALQEEENQLKAETLHLICQDFVKVSEKILAKLTENTPMDRILDLFLEKCATLSKKYKDKINNVLKNQKVIFVSSSKNLTNNQQKKISVFLKKEFRIPQKCQIKYQTKENLIFGIELRIDSVIIDWTIQNYFDELEENLNISLLQNETVKE